CFERTPELVVALLGVLKAGAAYVPMEPSYPEARKSYIARQSAVSLRLEELPGDLDSFSDAPGPVRPGPDSLAYTIYTSGSTGTPKGVMIEHHSAANLIEWVNREFKVGPGTRVLMLSSVCFDLSVYDVFGALGAGASLVIARQEEIQDPAALLRLVVEQKVTFWSSVPSTLGLLVQYLEETDPGFRGEDLRLAFLSGDWIPLSLPERAKRFFPNLRVISLGGATEATVWSIFHPVLRIDEAWASIPYGRPLDNNTFYILDESLELVPPGVVGDLYIGGVGVARGYAGDPEKTAASYRPDPFSGPGQRLYRTGDLGRMLPEGEIEFLGRSDHQVKVRGFRIELGEIESQLSRAPGVREAVVLARTDRAGQRYLCGYVVASDKVSVGALQEHLAGSLPGYMIPDTFVFLSELPLTSNGKIDRKALPEPEAAYAAAEPAVGPQSETEAALVEIWEEVLGLSGLGTTLDFFALGGHSLSAIRILTRVRRRFEVDLPLPDFFDNPTVAGLAAVVERLRGSGLAALPLRRSERPERLPLSFAQERLWFLDQLQPGGSVYNIPLALRLRGDLSWSALAASLDEVVARHEVLRTTFAVADGRPVQGVHPELRLALPVADLSGLPEDARTPEADRLAREEAARPFDLARGPLARTTLLRLGREHHVALFTLHHIVSDGWSMGVLVQEVGALYAAFLRGERPALPELPIQYADFALWQRQHLAGGVLAGQIAFWKEHLAGAPPVLDLPSDRPRPPVQRFRGARVSTFLPSDRLPGLAEPRPGTTPFMLLLAAFQTLLSRLSGQEDLVVGTPVAGRNRLETENLIGFFVNTLALRAGLGGDPRFADALARVREVTVAAYAHEDLPFEKLVEELQPERSLAHAPVFQVVLVLQNAPMESLELPGLTLEPLPVEPGTTKFDLTVSLHETPQGLLCFWEHDSDLFDESTIRRFQGSFAALLAAALADPAQRLSELPLLADAERQELLLWNRARPTAPPALCLHELFALQAQARPTAVAVSFEDRELSYGELDERSGRLARRLRAAGVGPEVPVALCLERSPELVVALLAVLKAGGAYVPIDPAYPRDRQAYILADSGARVLLSERALAGGLSAVGVRTILLDEPGEDLPAPQAGGLPPGATPESLAYVIYTSGSTGRPKGVLVRHANVVRLFRETEPWFGFDERDVWTLFHSPAFDFSVWEIWGALLYGGRLVVVPWAVSRSPEDFHDLLRREGVTVLNQTPSAFRQLVAADAARGGELALRQVIFGGEALELQALRPWFERHGDERPRLVNMYGITETTVHVTWRPLTAADLAANGSPIGRAIPDLDLRVLDRSGQPVPVGVAGELCVGGAGLARGYLGRPELTAGRFVPDPFGESPGARLYRSGDLVRYRASGDLEHLGRIDHQVKIRGFRIELGEIETALAAFPGVREAVVAVREDRRGDRTLAAWVAAPAPRPAAGELRAFLRERLPEYMVPATFVFLDALPLTANGKVDRRALPAPDEGRVAREASAAPAAGIEREIAAVWQEVLGVERVGVDDNFFDLGGHSLRLVEVQTRLREALGRDVPVVELFRHPTVAALATYLEGKGTAADSGIERARVRASEAQQPASRSGFAVIGLAGRFPGAADPDRFWDNLRQGVESIRPLSDEELLAEGVDPAILASGRYVKAAADLADIDLFDAELFGFSPREAEALDPQQRLFLECAWQALESAGYDSRRLSIPVGVYAGAQMSTYLFNLLSRPDIMESLGPLALQASVDKDFVAMRTSYALDLKGPSVAVQTACSTSLVAVHFACQALANRECDMALAGGVTVRVPQRTGYTYQDAGVQSPDGHCRAFDARARGTVSGNGVGVVVLKRLEDALRDGNTIHAVVRGSAINNDGALKVGFTAPGVEGQAQVIAAAQAAAGISPDSISYVETHGTGTELGDPIEVAALTRAFRAGGAERTGFCALGSVKTNIGHLDAAAGIAGFLKAVLALKHREIPPSLHFEEPNPAIDFAASPFYVNARLAAWPAGEGPRRAGVSSFGIGGTNAHVVLEEAPEPVPSGPSRPWQLLVLSARTPAALEEATDRLAAFFADGGPAASLADAAYTLQVARRTFPYRRALVSAAPDDAAAALRGRDPERLLERRAGDRRPVAFLLPGQGAQHPGMGRGLYESEAVFRREVDACAERLAPRLGRDLRELLFPAAGEAEAEAAGLLRQTRFAQPALFVVEHALARLWLSWGVTPTALIGHSLGEYVAACLAGVLSLEDALDLVAARGELMQELPPGAMLSVELPEAEIAPELEGGLALAAVNGPGLCVVSGPDEEIARLEARLAARGAAARRLHTSHAFHSAMMEPVLRPFAERVSRVALRAPAIPYLSNVTGTWITAAQATDPAYWVRHLRETVRFGPGLEQLLAGAPEGLTLLEVGPGRTLGELARRLLAPRAGHDVVASMRHPREEEPDGAALLRSLGRLWLAGVEIDWDAFHSGEVRRRIPLPTYPFQRRRFWIERRRQVAAPAPAPEAEGARDGVLSPPEALPAETDAGHERPDLATPYVAPRNATERRLAGVWQELLHIAGIGIHDDFFELGGNSLMGTRLASRVRDAFGREMPLETLFTAPTVARLAAWLDAAETGTDRAATIPRAPRTGELPLSFAQQRLLFLDLLAHGDVAYNLPLGLRLSGPLEPAALRRALARLILRHEVLRTTFRVAVGRAWQVVSPEVPAEAVRLPVVDLVSLDRATVEQQARQIAGADSARRIDLATGPMLRALLLRLAPAEHVLVITVHHIAGDGWSWGILLSDLVELYEAEVEERAPRLPELPLQYADFAAWQRGWLEGEVLDRQLAYWQRTLAGLPVVEIPPDRPRPEVRKGRGAVRHVALGAELVDALRRLAREEEATLFMVLLSAFCVLLHHSTGGDDLIVGTDVANRNRSETEGILGLFVNQLVLRNDLSGNPGFREILRRVRGTAFEAFAHQDAPFDKLVEVLNPARDMSRTPLFQVKLVLQNTPMEARSLRNLTVVPFDLHNQTAKFDLLLNLNEGPAGIAGTLEYDSDLYEPATIERVLESFGAVLTRAAAEPDARLGEIEEELRASDRQAAEQRARERRESKSRTIERARRKAIAAP
ncbi:MAG TPA: amino acid adenylation domain-containing protein, partial [Thermoanaerobaculia bacterium]|nr:amino acid adenylation domain-containing protein [Thermoanaerobaculia bacterium]